MGSGAMPGRFRKGQRMRMLAFVGAAGVAPLLFIGGPDWARKPTPEYP